jgi:DNA polymerase I
MAEKLYLIDGMAFAFRAFYAIRSAMSDDEGRPTNAIYGFTRVLLKLLREENPSHIAVVFDAPGKNFRHEMYPEYKANRSETPEELKEQFPRMHEVVRALDVALVVAPGVEADDAMATLARHGEARGMEVVLVTGDKDLQQLVSEKVRVFDPSKAKDKQWIDMEAVQERFGVPPWHVIDALALIGDASDNVPGVRGIGDKTAKKLLEKYASLEGLYEHIDELKGKQKEKLAEDKEQAFFSRELVRVKEDVELECAVDDCKRQDFDRDKVAEAFEALAFHSLLEELLPGSGAAATPAEAVLVTEETQLAAVIEEMRGAGCFGVDTETTSVDPMRASLVGISFCCSAERAYYLPLAHTEEARALQREGELFSEGSIPQIPMNTALEMLRPLLADEKIGKVGHNIKYDSIVLERAGAPLRGIVMDTMVSSYLTDPSRLRHNLEEVSLQYLRRKPIPIAELIGSGSKTITFDHVPLERACGYAAEDAELTWRLREVFTPLMRERQLETLFQGIELPLIGVLARMEQQGVAINQELFEEIRVEIERRLAALEKTIFELAGEAFKINSPKQLQGILFDKLGLKPLRKTKTGYSTDVDVLEELAQEHALPGKVLEFRGLEKLRGTYVEALPKLVHPETGRIHSSFNQAVAATGRLSSSDPNLQNIPVRTELGKRIRQGFVPGSPDQRLISADYSQIELRILAHLSGDTALREAFSKDADVHRETAARVFDLSAEEVTADMRRQAKAVNFGVIYGISAFGLAKNLRIPQQEAARFIEDYFSQYPQVREWLDGCLEQAKKDGYVCTLLNRRRYMPELKSSDHQTRRYAERAAINMPVQGSAADIIKRAMIQLDEALQGRKAAMLLQVHDELVLEAAASEAEDVAALTRQIMENACALDVPLKVDVGIGQHWAEIH